MAYDQDRVMAVSENAGDLLLTERFEQYRKDAGFSMYLCHAYDPESKGKIESVVKYVKRNFLTCRIFNGIQELSRGPRRRVGGVVFTDQSYRFAHRKEIFHDEG